MSDMAIEIEPRKITVAEYLRMAEVGILGEDEQIELLDGAIVRMSPIGRTHWGVHWRIVDYLTRLLNDRAMVVGQSSIALGDQNHPQPDVIVLPRTPDAFMDRDPEPSEIYAVIEVANSSLRKDTGIKRDMYGRFQIPDYVVVDLNSRSLLCYRATARGEYGPPERLGSGAMFRLAAFPDVELDVDRFLPPPNVPLAEKDR